MASLLIKKSQARLIRQLAGTPELRITDMGGYIYYWHRDQIIVNYRWIGKGKPENVIKKIGFYGKIADVPGHPESFAVLSFTKVARIFKATEDLWQRLDYWADYLRVEPKSFLLQAILFYEYWLETRGIATVTKLREKMADMHEGRLARKFYKH